MELGTPRDNVEKEDRKSWRESTAEEVGIVGRKTRREDKAMM